MDKQAIYEAAYDFFTRPGAVRAIDENGSCLYRWDPETHTSHATAPMRCAIGCQLPDHLYSVDMEGKGVDSLIDYSLIEQAADLREHFGIAQHEVEVATLFLYEIQCAHDEAEDIPDCLRRLNRVAREYELVLRAHTVS